VMVDMMLLLCVRIKETGSLCNASL
jgi:hypothetical protein